MNYPQWFIGAQHGWRPATTTVPESSHRATQPLVLFHSPVVLVCFPHYFLCMPQICSYSKGGCPMTPVGGRLHLRRCWQTKRKKNTETVLRKDSEHKLEDLEVSESSHILLPSSLLYSVLPSNSQFSALPEPSYICCVLNDYPIKQQNAMKSGLFLWPLTQHLIESLFIHLDVLTQYLSV